jgi:predicted DNA-binding transcriptional regulator AlpA
MKTKQTPVVVVKATVDPEYVNLKTAADVIGVSVSTYKRLSAVDPTFPKLVRLSTKVVLTPLAELRAWMARQAEATATAPRQSNGLPRAAVKSLRGQIDAPKPTIAKPRPVAR